MNTDTPETDAELNRVKRSLNLFVIDEADAMADFARNLERQRNNTLALLEREQLRLAACGVIALADTPESAAEARQMHSDYESAALDSVKRRVDECIALRQMVRELRDTMEYILGDSVSHIRNTAIEQAQSAITKANQLLP